MEQMAKKYKDTYKRVLKLENDLSAALGELGRIVSEIMDDDYTANLCSGGEIEFTPSNLRSYADDIALRDEDVLKKIERNGNRR